MKGLPFYRALPVIRSACLVALAACAAAGCTTARWPACEALTRDGGPSLDVTDLGYELEAVDLPAGTPVAFRDAAARAESVWYYDTAAARAVRQGPGARSPTAGSSP